MPGGSASRGEQALGLEAGWERSLLSIVKDNP